MNCIEKLENNQCRTCYNATKGLRHLTNLTKCSGKPQQISYAELITEISSINIMEDIDSEFPQFICDGCSRKLKAAHAFIHQIREVNERLVAILNGQDETNKQLNCLQEAQVDIQSCLEIKMEQDDTTGDDKTYAKSHVSLKQEELEEILPQIILGVDVLSEQKDDEKVDNDEHVALEKNKIDSKLGLNNFENVNKDDEIQIDFKPSLDLFEPYENASDSDNNGNGGDQENEMNQKVEEEEANFQYSKKHKKESSRKFKKSKEILENPAGDIVIALACSQCNKIFTDSKGLMRHQRTSHIPEDQKCTCPLCFRKFSRSCNMYTHMRAFHGPDTVPLIRQPSTEERSFQCDKCPRNYMKRKQLNIHIKSKHGHKNESSGKDTGISIENVNNETPVKPKRQEIRSLCSICGISFSSKTPLDIHMRRHTGERPFKCDLCDRAYPRISELTCHRRIHTGEKPFACKICGKTFRVSSKMTMHMRSHTNIRPYKCTQCERSFKYSKDLSIHFRIHTGERPYCCNICGSTFTQSNTLKAHRVKLGHMDTVVENINI